MANQVTLPLTPVPRVQDSLCSDDWPTESETKVEDEGYFQREVMNMLRVWMVGELEIPISEVRRRVKTTHKLDDFQLPRKEGPKQKVCAQR